MRETGFSGRSKRKNRNKKCPPLFTRGGHFHQKGKTWNYWIYDSVKKTLKILKGMAGQVFEKYRCDPSIFHPVYLLPVGIYAGGKCYIMTQEITDKAAGGKKTDVLEWIFREAEEKEIHSSRPAVVQEDHALQKEIKEVRIINEKKTLSRCGKAEYRVYLTKAVRFIFEKGYLQIRKPVYFSPFLNLEDDGEECREWEKLDNLPEEWEETYDVNTETEILAYKK